MAFIRLRMFSCMSWLLRLLFKLSWMNVEFFKCFSFQVFTCFFFFILLIWLITLVDFFHFWTNFPFKGKSHWIGYYGGGALFSQSYPTLVTPWTVAHQAPLFMGFHRQEFLNGLPFPSSGDLSHPGIELMSPALQAVSCFAGLPLWLNVKESACYVGGMGLVPGSGRSPGGTWKPTPVFLPGELHGQRSLASYSPWGCQELDTI